MQPLNELQLSHAPDIAAILGWKDMKDVALRSGLTDVQIDSCQQSNNNPEEQTLQLLQKWMEALGRGAENKLISILRSSGKKGKAEKVEDILKRGNSATSAAPV